MGALQALPLLERLQQSLHEVAGGQQNLENILLRTILPILEQSQQRYVNMKEEVLMTLIRKVN